MDKAKLAAARREEWEGRDGEPLEPRWTEHPPGVLRAVGWYCRQQIEAFCDQAEAGRVPWYRGKQ